jgi:hypothetical protein
MLPSQVLFPIFFFLWCGGDLLFPFHPARSYLSDHLSKKKKEKKIKFELESLPHIEMMVVWSIRRKYQRTNMRKNHHHPLGWMMMMMTDHTYKRLFSVFLSLPCEQRIFFPFLRIFSLQRRDEREMDAHRSIFPLLYPLTTHSGWLRWIWNG